MNHTSFGVWVIGDTIIGPGLAPKDFILDLEALNLPDEAPRGPVRGGEDEK